MAAVLGFSLLLLVAAPCASFPEPADGAPGAHSSCPGPLSLTAPSTFALASAFAPLCGPASLRTRSRCLPHPRRPSGLARLLALAFAFRSGDPAPEGEEQRTPAQPGVAPPGPPASQTGLAPAGGARPDTCPGSSSALSGGRPPTVDFGPPLPDPRSKVSTMDFLLHKRQPPALGESSWDPCPPPCELSVDSLQSRGQPRTVGHRLWFRNVKTHVSLDSTPGQGPPLMHTEIPLALPEPGDPTANLPALESAPLKGCAPSQHEPPRAIRGVAAFPSEVPTSAAPLSRGLPPTSTKSPLDAPQRREPKPEVSGLLSPQDKRPPSRATEGAPDPHPPASKLSALRPPLNQRPPGMSSQGPIDPHLLGDRTAGVSAEDSPVCTQHQPAHGRSRPQPHLPAQAPSSLSAPNRGFGGGQPPACPQEAERVGPPAFSPFVPEVDSPCSQGKPAHVESHLRLHTFADPPSRLSHFDPSGGKGPPPALAPAPPGPQSCVPWGPSPELSLGLQVLICPWALAPLAGRGWYLVEEKHLIPVTVHPPTARPSQKQRPDVAEGEESGLGNRPLPLDDLGPDRLPDSPVAPQPPEREGQALAAPPAQQEFSRSGRPAGNGEMGQEERPGPKEVGHPDPDRRNPRPPDRLGNGSGSWPVLGAVQDVVPWMSHCAKVLMGLWPGAKFNPLFWWYITWGVLLFLGVLWFRGGKECRSLEQEKLEELSEGMKLMDKALEVFHSKLKFMKTVFHRKREINKNLSKKVSALKELLRMSEEENQRWKNLFHLLQEGHDLENLPEEQMSLHVAGDEAGACEHVPGEPQALSTEGSLAELLQVKDRFSRLEGEVEALREQAERWRRQEAQVRELEGFFLWMRDLLEASAPGMFPRCEGLAFLCTPTPEPGA